MISVRFDDSFEGWRHAARALVAENIRPDDVEWIAGSAQESIFEPGPSGNHQPASFSVPADFVRLAESVACFRDPGRWSLLYRVLWRLTHGERSLMNVVVDRDVHRMQRMASAIRRDEHKMKAFVRFKRVGDEDEESARYIAWFTPAHLILERVAPFFARRFASMYWSILTPDGSVHWNRDQLAFGPALDRSSAPATDELEVLWRTYYANVFNPARLKLSAMRSEMPKKYWSGLPEAALIPGLVADAPKRVREMKVSEPSRGRELEDPRSGSVRDT